MLLKADRKEIFVMQWGNVWQHGLLQSNGPQEMYLVMAKVRYGKENFEIEYWSDDVLFLAIHRERQR